MKLLAIGVDGLDYQVYRHTKLDWKPQVLPSLYLLSGPCWMTIYTGAPRQLHGIGQVVGIRSDGSVAWLDLELPCIWDVLGDAGVKVALCNLPITSPPKEVNGWMVGGYPLWEEPYGRGIEVPEWWFKMADINYKRQLPAKDSDGGYTFDDIDLLFYTYHPWMEVLRYGHFSASGLLAWFALHAEDAHFGFIAITWPDRLGHFKGIMKAHAEIVTRWVDFEVDYLIRSLKPEKVLLFSDHGFRGLRHQNEGVIAAMGLDLGASHIGDVASEIVGVFGLEMPEYDVPFLADPPQQVKRRLDGWGYMT